MEEKKIVKILGMTMSESEILECISCPVRLSCTNFDATRMIAASDADIQMKMEENKTE